MKHSLANSEPLNKLTGLTSNRHSTLKHKACLTYDQALMKTIKSIARSSV